MSLPNKPTSPDLSRPGAYAGNPRPEGETITLFIIGAGLMVTGFFAGWMYFQIRQGLGPGRGKERIITAAVSPLSANEEPWLLLGPDNLSWKVMAPRGEVVLEIERIDQPLQTIRIPHDVTKSQGSNANGSSPANDARLDAKDAGVSKLVWIRQKLGESEELWTFALGAADVKDLSGNATTRETVRVALDLSRMGPVSRGGPVRLDGKSPETLAGWEQKKTDKPLPGTLKSFRMNWVPASK